MYSIVWAARHANDKLAKVKLKDDNNKQQSVCFDCKTCSALLDSRAFMHPAGVSTACIPYSSLDEEKWRKKCVQSPLLV